MIYRVALLILVVAFALLNGCAPCKDYKQIIVERDASIVERDGIIAERDATIEEGKALAQKLREEIEGVEAEKLVLIDQINEIVVVEIPDSILFASAGVMVMETMIPTLEAIRDACAEYPNWDIYVEGYTDSQKIEPDWQELWPTNWELGAARAAAVTRYMTNWLDMDATRFAVVSYGPFRPVADNDTAEGREKNRFVRIVMHRVER
ncbi:flagellar motor protein MotB [bacterium]|jgi:chemotaxis protein MotB|nr:flagellar motor protein MotB [bacterium]